MKKSILNKIILILFFISSALLSQGQSFVLSSDSFVPLYSGKIQWADLDNDGDLDIICSGFTNALNTYFTKVYENNNGSFTSRSTALPNIRNGSFATGDYDKDGDLDVLISGLTDTGNISVLYENSGAFSFSLKYSFPGLINATTSWFDIDNDNDLDFILSGVDDTDPTTAMHVEAFIYENVGGAFSLLANTNLPPCTQCSMDWADSNGDGKIDLLITGFGDDNAGHTAVYLNNGDKTFQKYNGSIFKNAANGMAKWGDFDNDGDMDVLLNGMLMDGTIFTAVYENKGFIFIERTDIVIDPVGENYLGGTNWVDYNNDGNLDILVSGRKSILTTSTVFKLYRNNGNGMFAEVSEMNFNGLADGSTDFGDYDNDGDIDFCFLGITGNNLAMGIYKNLLIDAVFSMNSNPVPPSQVSFSENNFFRRQLSLNWSSGSDIQTPGKGLSYNFYLRNVTSAISLPTSNLTSGYLLSANPPNGHSKKAFVNNIPEGNNFWAVQSIDGAKEGSFFSSEKSFYQINGPESSKSEIIDVQHVKLTWIDNSSIETSYQVSRSKEPSMNFTPIATLAQNASSYSDTYIFLTDTYYYYRINAANSTRASAYDSLRVLIPTAPSSLLALSLNASKISLSWNDLSTFESGYIIERKKSVAVNFESIDTLHANTNTFEDSGLSEGTNYDYRIRAINEYGSSAFSNISSAQTNFRPLGKDFVKEILEDGTLSFSAVDFTDSFSDPDIADELIKIIIKTLPQKGSLSLNSSPVAVGQQISSAQLGNLAFVPFPNVNGTTGFSFYNNDGKDNSLLDYSVAINIASVNDPPSFTIPGPIETDEDFANAIIVQLVPDPVPSDESQQVVTYSIQPSASDKVKVNFNSTTGKIVMTSLLNQFGKVELVLTANDGQSENNLFSDTVKVNIRPVNDPPVLSVISDQMVEYQAVVPLVPFTVSDVDDPISSVKLSGSSANQGLIKNDKISFQGDSNDKNIVLLPEEKSVGEALITISASDGKLISSAKFNLKVLSITEVLKFNERFSIYPNPFTSLLFVKTEESNGDTYTLIIWDILGREIIRQLVHEKEYAIDLNNICSGLYLLNIKKMDGQIVLKAKIVKK
jgi:hypothetical protein